MTGKEKSQPLWRNEKGQLKPEFLKMLRLATGLTPAEAAAMVHTSEGSWNDWESGRKGTLIHEGLLELFCHKTRIQYPLHFDFTEEELKALEADRPSPPKPQEKASEPAAPDHQKEPDSAPE